MVTVQPGGRCLDQVKAHFGEGLLWDARDGLYWVDINAPGDTPEWPGSAFVEASADLGATLKGTLRGDGYGQTSTYFSSTGKTLDPGTQIPGYFIANFRAGVDVKDSGLSFALNLKDAFNRIYHVASSGFTSLFSPNTPVVPGDPRAILGEVRFGF